MKKRRKWFLYPIYVVFGLVGIFILVSIIFEFRPKATMPVEATVEATESFTTGQEMTIVTWNTGYGALGDNVDFFMDGGTMVKTAERNRLAENLSTMINTMKEIDPQIILLQEVDKASDRTFRVDEKNEFEIAFPAYSSAFTNNFKVLYCPYPWPPLGHLDSGIMTLAKSPVSSAERIRLPCPFKFPTRMYNLKRCLLVTRYPLEGSDKELVVVNLHLEAYDNGEGKVAQTKVLVNYLHTEVEKGNYVIAGGDFNQVFENVDISQYYREEGGWPGRIELNEDRKEFTWLMDSSTPTCRSLRKPLVGADLDTFQFYVIDGFVVSKGVAVMSVETKDMGFVCSDHNPVVMRFGLKEE
ncbi:MAG: endonuclease [Blautia sp.]|nr:endonuclease [Blautia sp.]